ncbi:MAG: formylglycine-generating enzyme family protein, partial [Verrucomicrobiota bacterium]
MGYTGGGEGPDIPEDEVPQHPVTLTRGFWLLDHEVTQGEYEVVMGSNPSRVFKGVDRPVWPVTWEKAVEFCQKLTVWDRVAGRITWQQEYRLPTEAEWEYAACAGTTGSQGWDDSIGWWSAIGSHEPMGPQPVKKKAANGWGLYDMVGNVWEWCAD